MGTVYRAHDPQLGRDVALKLLRVDRPMGARDLERFRREVLTLAQLRHPNVVGVHTAGAHEGRPFFVQDLVEGQPLDRRLEVAGPLPLREAAAACEALAAALQAAHEAGILHRDVKPANVIMTPRGEPVLIDFGVAKNAALALSKSGLTKTGQGLGSPGYWSPEQACGELDLVGPRSDVYGLGATLYALLVGRAPFEGQGVAGNLMLTINEPARPPSELRPDVSQDLEAICLKCLEKEPGRRYASAGDLGRDLQRYLDGGRPLARGGSTPNSRRRLRLLAGAFGAVALLVGLSAVAVAVGLPPGDDARGDVLASPVDAVAPILSLVSPLEWTVVDDDEVALRGHVKDAASVRVAVGSRFVEVPPGRPFELHARLRPGANTLEVTATDASGNASAPRSLRVLRAPRTNDAARLVPGLGAGESTGESTIRIDATITIGPAQVLILGPGTTLSFAPEAGIVCEGQLWCLGTRASPVRLAPREPVVDLRSTDAVGWEGVRAQGAGAVVVLAWTTVEGVVPNFVTAVFRAEGAAGRTAKAEAKRRGGALTALDGATVYLSDSVLKNSRPPGSNRGGGLLAEGTATALTTVYAWRTRFEGCWATRGGGARFGPGSEAYVFDSVFAENRALRGGGLAADVGAVTLVFERVQFSRNCVDRDGGGATLDCSARLKSCIFLENEARGSGGALHALRRAATLIDCRFVSNHAAQAGALDTTHVLDSQGCTFEGNDPPQVE